MGDEKKNKTTFWSRKYLPACHADAETPSWRTLLSSPSEQTNAVFLCFDGVSREGSGERLLDLQCSGLLDRFVKRPLMNRFKSRKFKKTTTCNARWLLQMCCRCHIWCIAETSAVCVGCFLWTWITVKAIRSICALLAHLHSTGSGT